MTLPHQTSVIASLFKSLYRRLTPLEQRINYLYQASRIFRLKEGLWKKIKLCFKYSFWGKISEIKEEGESQGNPSVLAHSRSGQFLMDFYRKRKDELGDYFKRSFVGRLQKRYKEELHLLPVRMFSIIIVTAIISIEVLAFFLHREISLLGWAIMGLLLFVSMAGLSCDADWPTLKNSSIILKSISKK